MTSAPKIAYGKKRSALLPLTAEQFRRSSVFEIPTEDTEAQRQLSIIDQRAKHRVTAEDSQLSYAESSEEVSSTPVNDVAEAAKASSSELKSRSARRKLLKITSVSSVRPTEVPGKPSAASQQLHASPRRRVRRPIAPKRHNPRKPSPNELHLVPMRLIEGLETSLMPAKPHIGFPSSLANDSFTRHNRYTDVGHGANVAEDALAAVRPKTGLSTHRKRLRTTVREHKTIQELKSKQEAGVNEPSHFLPGDGFEKSELQIAHRHCLKLRHRRQRKSEPLWQGFQQLTLCAEGADEHDFIRAPIKNEPIPGQTRTLVLSADRAGGDTESFVASRLMSHHSEENNLPTVGLLAMSRQQELVVIELSSLSAPVRQYSVSVCSDEEDHEEDLDEGAAESYVDQVDVADDAIEEIVEIEPDTRGDDEFAAESANEMFTEQRFDNKAARLESRRARLYETAGPIRRPSGRRSIEVTETIFEDPDSDPDQDFLLDDGPYPVPLEAIHASLQPRSILKSSTALQAPIHTGPELTARNTRRNSRMTTGHSIHFSSPPPSSDPNSDPMLDEESRYFTSVQQQLAPSPAQPRSIIRKKSNNPQVGYAYGDAMEVQVPYSGSLTVAKTSPVRERFSDES
ncbi:hypothetical protein B0A48_13948 [Cryoendolithus antarcticus]|uniref:Uncharacterized protein n=1 Tax=Cryoendolithus antarcticus TaxID=1507870 RepID=A0A1V8SMJ2_9PEZI|nr:hypothetical protein B0A48_13948 [Cryoendolithus antarcticus]